MLGTRERDRKREEERERKRERQTTYKYIKEIQNYTFYTEKKVKIPMSEPVLF